MNLSFIKLDINIMNDTKIKLIRKLPDGDSILVLWVGLLCLGMKSGRPGIVEIGDGIPFTAETLSTELDIPINTVRLGLETFSKFKMVELWADGETYITNFEKHQELNKIAAAKEKSRLTSQAHRERLKKERDGHVTIRDATDKEEDKDKDKDKDKEEDKIRLEQEFNKFWKLYAKKDNRKGCLAKWKKLKAIDKEKIFETLPAYVASTPDVKFRKNPATYLNQEAWNNEIIQTQQSAPKQQQGKTISNYADNFLKKQKGINNGSSGSSSGGLKVLSR